MIVPNRMTLLKFIAGLLVVPSKQEIFMRLSYTADIRRYIPPDKIPLYVEEVPLGGHPEKCFHDHEFSEAVIILEGEAKHIAGKSSCTVRAGDVLVLHPGVSHGYDKTGNMALLNLVYDYKKLSMPILDGYALPLFHTFFPSGRSYAEENLCRPATRLPEREKEEIVNAVFRLREELRSSRPGSVYLGLAIFMDIMARLGRCDAGSQEKHLPQFLIGDVIAYMNRNLDSPIELDNLLKQAMMSRRNFFRHFKNTTGCTPFEYLRQLRLKQAVELLSNTTLSIGEIAVRCGFYDSNHFCRIFREKLNTSPRRFRSRS